MSTELATKAQNPIKLFFERDSVKSKFAEMLGKRAPQFITSVLQIATSSDKLQKADPISIYNAAAVAATLDLLLNNNLGFAWIVAYGSAAQFQMGWKGYVQLAQRSGQYLKLNVVEVYESQFKSWNSLTEELKADFEAEPSGKVVGYCAYFKLINGFEKVVYWSKDKVNAHGKKYSKSFSFGPWKDEFDKMAKKTVLKNMLSTWGILSIEMQKAMVFDQAVIEDVEAEEVKYPDSANAVEEITIDDLRELLDLKRDVISVEELKDANRIINGNEVQSFKKLQTLLASK
jgi:recombination protein RecT